MNDAPPPASSSDSLLPPGAVQIATQTQMVPQIQTLPLHFSGQAGEFFRIWIVNVLLSVVTLGIYSPWARVRTRQYFYGHTRLDGHSFEYTAQPLALLRGFLLVGVLFVVYSVSQRVGAYQWISYVLAGLFFVLYPWLVYRSLRFNAASTVYRGLSFRFHGTARAAYVAYFLLLLSVPFTLGLTYPLALWMQRRYLLENGAYGTARTRWGKDVGPVYLSFLIALGIGVAVASSVALLIFAAFLLIGLSGSLDRLPRHPDTAASGSAQVVLFFGLLALGYTVVLITYTALWQYIRSALLKYSLQDLYVGETLRLQATFSPVRLAWIGVSNLLAQVVSLGLLTPWAAVRRSRYLLGGIAVQSIASLDDFQADAGDSESALGEAAHEFFNFDLGF